MRRGKNLFENNNKRHREKRYSVTFLEGVFREKIWRHLGHLKLRSEASVPVLGLLIIMIAVKSTQRKISRVRIDSSVAYVLHGVVRLSPLSSSTMLFITP